VALAFLTVAGAGADQFQLTKNGVGPIAMETSVEVKGKTAEFTGTARNDSGVPIQRAEWCVQAKGQKSCAFKLWTTGGTWQPGETLKWTLAGKAAKGFPAHLVSLVSLQLEPAVEESRRQAARLAEQGQAAVASVELAERAAAARLAEEEKAAAMRLQLEEKAAAARRELADKIQKAEAGDLDAQKWLAYAYDAGDGAPANPGEAAKWYRKAAEQDDSWAEWGLGFLYLSGRGVPPSSAEAAKWIDRAASQGDSQAQYWLARLYFTGDGVPQDYMRAHMWANLAASVGVKEAVPLRDVIARQLSPEQLVAAQSLAGDWRPRRTAGPTSSTAGEQRVVRTGSGFGVSRDGYVITNYHVIGDCNAVRIADGATRVLAPVAEEDPKNDLALLKSERTFDSPAHIRTSPLKLGEPVWAAGFPLSGILASSINVTPGAVSSEAGIDNDVTRVQVTAPVQPGNSGGPLLGKDGNVAGVVVATLGGFGFTGSGLTPQNVNFAIKSSVLREFLDSKHFSYVLAGQGDPSLDPTVLAERAGRFTVSLECWK
jgi:TPR repeat protein